MYLGAGGRYRFKDWGEGDGKQCSKCGQCHGLCLVTENGAKRVRESPTVTGLRRE